MKEIILKLIQWRVWVPIVMGLVIGYGIYKGIIEYTDLIEWFEQLLTQIKITIG